MNAREAAARAKDYVAEMLQDEGISNLGLEEIEYDPADNNWSVTVGFSRPWNSVRDAAAIITGEPAVKRVYRVVVINDNTMSILSMKRRENVDA